MLKNGILKTLWSRRDETIELFQARQECRAVHLRIHIFFFKKKSGASSSAEEKRDEPSLGFVSSPSDVLCDSGTLNSRLTPCFKHDKRDLKLAEESLR
jgi:hypothetical protein